MQKIVPHLWYDKEAKEAAQFYISIFEQSKLVYTKVLKNPPPFGDAEIVRFELAGQQFMAISAGPYFKFNPTISLMVACSTSEEVDKLWEALSEGGTELMPLGEYPFSKRYAWVQDRYGLSWQLMLVEGEQEIQKITPCLLFSYGACGKAEEAIKYYAELFENSEIGMMSRYGEGEAASSRAKVNYAVFKLDGMAFSAMDNGYDVDYTFNEAFSFIINCKDQKEIDYFWEKLSAMPEAESCGWCKDQFGVSWQVLPSNWEETLFGGSEEEVQRVNAAVFEMKKIDLETLEKIKFGISN
ncbi:MAG: VOC family protein [Epulopiscium sp.]|jgi:predicted 3-demethylubiquinone-9 3-methyltransferase (glyoxalase superfamily)|nr:VOC family protein [Candidatus Epulonipiscium sp.]